MADITDRNPGLFPGDGGTGGTRDLLVTIKSPVPSIESPTDERRNARRASHDKRKLTVQKQERVNNRPHPITLAKPLVEHEERISRWRLKA